MRPNKRIIGTIPVELNDYLERIMDKKCLTMSAALCVVISEHKEHRETALLTIRRN
jgi:hypothetical protein